MQNNYSRRERLEDKIQEAKAEGKKEIKVSLFPSERKKLEKAGYAVIPIVDSKLSAPCKVILEPDDADTLIPYHIDL